MPERTLPKKYPHLNDVGAVIRTIPNYKEMDNKEIYLKLVEIGNIEFPIVDTLEELKSLPLLTIVVTKDLAFKEKDPQRSGHTDEELFSEHSPLRVLLVRD